MSPRRTRERDIWRRPRTGVVPPSELRGVLRDHPAWTLSGQRFEREWRFKDLGTAFGFVERLAAEVEDFGRRPDIRLLDGNRVPVMLANPHRAGVTVAEVRLLAKVDAAAERYRSAPRAPDAAVGAAVARRDAHEHQLTA